MPCTLSRNYSMQEALGLCCEIAHRLPFKSVFCVYVKRKNVCNCHSFFSFVILFFSALEINSNGRSKQRHVKSCPVTTKNIISPLPQCLWPPNLTG